MVASDFLDCKSINFMGDFDVLFLVILFDVMTEATCEEFEASRALD